MTVAPFTNPLPFTVMVNGPVAVRLAGVTDATVGYGFASVIVALALTVGLATLVTVTITDPERGMAAGGVYSPPVLMVPADPVAPAGSATVQATVVGVMPVILSEN